MKSFIQWFSWPLFCTEHTFGFYFLLKQEVYCLIDKAFFIQNIIGSLLFFLSDVASPTCVYICLTFEMSLNGITWSVKIRIAELDLFGIEAL